MVLLDKVRERSGEFDVLHFHVDYLHFPLFRTEAGRTLTTLHGRQHLPDHLPFYAHFPEMPLVSICNAQTFFWGRIAPPGRRRSEGGTCGRQAGSPAEIPARGWQDIL